MIKKRVGSNLCRSDWDSPRTLVVVFGAASFLDNCEPLRELSNQFPQAKLDSRRRARFMDGR